MKDSVCNNNSAIDSGLPVTSVSLQEKFHMILLLTFFPQPLNSPE